MPLSWKISPLEHVVVCVCDGVVTLEDIWGFYDALEKSRALPYRKIIDSTTGTLALSEGEVGRLIARTNRNHEDGSAGAMAIVAPSRRPAGLAKLLRGLATIDRPLRIFPNIHDARRWLETRPLVRRPSSKATRPT